MCCECPGAIALAAACTHDLILLGRLHDRMGDVVEALRAASAAPIIALVAPGLGVDWLGSFVAELSGFLPRTLDLDSLAGSLYEIAVLALPPRGEPSS